MEKKRSQLNGKSSKYIEENILKNDPEGLPLVDAPKENEIIPTKVVPEYRRVQFINGRDPGQALEFHYHSKTHPLKKYILFHGMEYDLPLEIIEHLEDCKQNHYGHRWNEAEGRTECFVKSFKYLYQCRSVRRAA